MCCMCITCILTCIVTIAVIVIQSWQILWYWKFQYCPTQVLLYMHPQFYTHAHNANTLHELWHSMHMHMHTCMCTHTTDVSKTAQNMDTNTKTVCTKSTGCAHICNTTAHMYTTNLPSTSGQYNEHETHVHTTAYEACHQLHSHSYI